MSEWTMKSSYTYGTCIKAGSLAEAVEIVTKVFTETGWGLPPGTINLNFSEVFAKKGVDENFRPMHVLGFCHPKTAHTVLSAEPAASVLLPCSCTVAEKEPGVYEVSTIAPNMMGKIMDNHDKLAETVQDVDEKIKKSLQALPQDEELKGCGWGI